MRILLIEHDPNSAGWLGPRLEAQGFRITIASDAERAIRDGATDAAAAIVIELGNEAADGRRVTTALRSAGVTLPLVIVCTRSDWRETIASLDAGADDFVIMPTRSEEIAARLRATIRRSKGLSGDRICSGDFEMDLNARCAWFRGQCLELTRNEFLVLRLLLLNPGKVVSHEEIRAEISPGAQMITLNAIEVQIARLRKKIGPGPIRTVRGLGYRYAPDNASSGAPPREICLARTGEPTVTGSDVLIREPLRAPETTGEPAPFSARHDGPVR